MTRWGLVVLIVAAFAGSSLGQMTPEEAAKRLQERQAARQAERDRLVQIKEGTLEDMKAEIDALKKEVASLKAQIASAAPGNADAPVVVDPSDPMHVKAAPSLKFTTSIDVGASRQQLVSFISMHRSHFRIARDVKSAADHQELMTVELWYNDEVSTGETSNGAQTFRNWRKEKKAMASTELVIVNDVVTQVSGGKLDLDAEQAAARAETAAEAKMMSEGRSRSGRSR